MYFVTKTMISQGFWHVLGMGGVCKLHPGCLPIWSIKFSKFDNFCIEIEAVRRVRLILVCQSKLKKCFEVIKQ